MIELEIFWKLQSLLSKLIIELNNKTINQNFKMRFGYNIYPPHSEFLIVIFHFSLITFNFNRIIIDEEEK